MNNEIIGVIGAGTMGAGIAQMFAENGFKTILWDVNESFVEKGIANIERRLSKSVEKGKLEPENKENIISLISKADKLESFAEADLVIEAIIENCEAKTGLYKKLEGIVSPQTIIGTNTSSLSVTDLSQSLKSPGRFLGVHFFNPPTKLQLVEVIATSSLDLKTMGKIEDILERCGKSAVKVNDSPGFIVNRLLLPYINEAAKLLDEGIAKPEDIDTAMCLGTLHPAGPLQVADLIGLDICKDILEKLADSLNNPGYKPAKSIVSLVEDGKLGRKTGEGFHTY
jgi:3-hydroxybutyryl-CoA dehydrogenase